MSRKIATSARAGIVTGYAAIFLGLGGFAGWAAIAPLDSAVMAPAQVKVEGYRKKVQHPEGGTIRELLVTDGAEVSEGQVIVRLDETRARASVGVLQGNMDAGRSREARLLAERDGLAQPVYPPDLARRRDDPAVDAMLRGQDSLFAARRESQQGETAILEQRIQQLDQETAGITVQIRSKEKQSRLVAQELATLSELHRKGLVERTRVIALEREAARLEGEIGAHQAETARARKAIGEARLQIIQLRTKQREEVVSELRTVQTELQDLQERLVAARHTLEHVEIRAPASGTVVALEVHTVGGVVKPGETLLEIVPRQQRLALEARIGTGEVDNVVAGQEARIRFTAFKQRTLPDLHGRVSQVSADSLTDQRSGTAYYLAKIEVPESELARLGDGNKLVPGMPAEVVITTGGRTAGQYLLQPVIDAVTRAGREE